VIAEKIDKIRIVPARVARMTQARLNIGGNTAQVARDIVIACLNKKIPGVFENIAMLSLVWGVGNNANFLKNPARKSATEKLARQRIIICLAMVAAGIVEKNKPRVISYSLLTLANMFFYLSGEHTGVRLHQTSELSKAKAERMAVNAGLILRKASLNIYGGIAAIAYWPMLIGACANQYQHPSKVNLMLVCAALQYVTASTVNLLAKKPGGSSSRPVKVLSGPQ
jgi:hypothetical protein